MKRFFATAMLCCLLLGGCGPWVGDPLVEVIGEVTLDRKVLTDAKVVFVPKRFRNSDGLINPLAFGKTDGTGRFELKSGDQKGVLLGLYRVLIFTTNALEEDAKQHIASKQKESRIAKLLNEPETVRTPGETVPAKYNLHSELVYAVEMPVGIVYPKFDLTSE